MVYGAWQTQLDPFATWCVPTVNKPFNAHHLKVHSIFKQAKFGINFQHIMLFSWFLMRLYQSKIKRNLFRRMFNSSPELLCPVPYSQKGSHFVDLWMFPVLFSGIALRLTLQLLNKSITIQFQHLFLFLYSTVLKRIWYLGTGHN